MRNISKAQGLQRLMMSLICETLLDCRHHRHRHINQLNSLDCIQLRSIEHRLHRMNFDIKSHKGFFASFVIFLGIFIQPQIHWENSSTTKIFHPRFRRRTSSSIFHELRFDPKINKRKTHFTRNLLHISRECLWIFHDPNSVFAWREENSPEIASQESDSSDWKKSIKPEADVV